MTTPARHPGARTARRPCRAPQPQSAAAPSPFPPIAEYAFLSNCHTGALVAPDGAIGWLCVPRFDSPSVFGTLLDRQGGHFRLGPFGTNVPIGARVRAGHEHARHDLARRRAGWVVVRDALTLGPRRAEDTDHAAHAAAVRRRRRPPARAHGRVHRGQRRRGPRVRAGVRLRPRARRLDARRRRPPHGRRERRRPDHPPAHGHALGIEGDRVRARRLLRAGRARSSARCRGPRASPRPADVDEAGGATRRHHALLARVDRPGADPRPPLARADPALGAGHQGPDVHADRARRSPRSPPRCPRRRAASATGTTATRGSATRPSPCRRCTG